MNAFLNDLCEWLKADAFGRKVLFVRNRTAGNQLLRMAAAHGVPAVNAVPASVREYMRALAAPVLERRGRRTIDSLTANIALQEIMAGSGDAFTTMGAVELSTAGSVLPQLDELERSGITPARLAGTGEDLLSSVWQKYLDWKRDNGYASEAELLDASAVPEGVSFAILSNVEADGTERAFLSRIPPDRLTVVRIGVPGLGDCPRNAYIRELPLPPEPKQVDDDGVECYSCQDIGSEVRFAYQYLIEHRIPAEQAVLVCPDDSFALRAEEEGRLLGFGVDSCFGTPAAMSRTALLLRCLLDWASRNYDAEALAPALVSGCMGLYNDRDRPESTGQEMLRVFRRQRVGWGRERWAALAASDNPGHARMGGLMKDWADYFEAPARPVRALAMSLTGLLGRCMVHGEENQFYLMTVDELSRVYSGNMRGRDYLARVEEAASVRGISGQMAEKPGNVYCCGYDMALYLDRTYFMMLGMNWDAFNKLDREFPLLHDDKKAALSGRLRLAGDRARGMRYAVKEFLVNRPDAHVVFSRARMDYAGGNDLIPSGIFEDAARKYLREDPGTGRRTIDGTPRVNILEREPLTRVDVYLKEGFSPDAGRGCADAGRDALWRKEFEERCHTATRLETACACPRRYTLTVQLGIDQEDPGPLAQYGQTWLGAADRGNLVHRVLDRYFTGIAPRLDAPDTDRLDRLLEEEIREYQIAVPVPTNLTDLTAETDAIRGIVLEAARMHAEDPVRRTVATEAVFGRDRPVVLSFGAHRITLAGRIDRVDRVGDEYEIIDYKTGRPHSFRREMKNKLQYYLYSLAWEALYPDRRISRASYYMLDGAAGIERITIGLGDECRAEMYQRMVSLLDLISDPRRAFTPAFELDEAKAEARYDSCPGYCPFKELCKEVFG